eukprot:CAMPEP_0202697282 /NCGR_PEP_ID=MMETSP1385-20130828/10609_1 /ASSEMBLY_ACC=CAM_ASM_000861 /TAXON_ID=933848 /ORGANISM="Elphidium margaritaceum" /LENGTH=506 /DNA_ID=CAMNT_0049353705 /DNA_START=35 /DNA_END=1552 /DNA_ORIENTATION=-
MNVNGQEVASGIAEAKAMLVRQYIDKLETLELRSAESLRNIMIQKSLVLREYYTELQTGLEELNKLMPTIMQPSTSHTSITASNTTSESPSTPLNKILLRDLSDLMRSRSTNTSMNRDALNMNDNLFRMQQSPHRALHPSVNVASLNHALNVNNTPNPLFAPHDPNATPLHTMNFSPYDAFNNSTAPLFNVCSPQNPSFEPVLLPEGKSYTVSQQQQHLNLPPYAYGGGGFVAMPPLIGDDASKQQPPPIQPPIQPPIHRNSNEYAQKQANKASADELVPVVPTAVPATAPAPAPVTAAVTAVVPAVDPKMNEEHQRLFEQSLINSMANDKQQLALDQQIIDEIMRLQNHDQDQDVVVDTNTSNNTTTTTTNKNQTDGGGGSNSNPNHNHNHNCNVNQQVIHAHNTNHLHTNQFPPMTQHETKELDHRTIHIVKHYHIHQDSSDRSSKAKAKAKKSKKPSKEKHGTKKCASEEKELDEPMDEDYQAGDDYADFTFKCGRCPFETKW